MKTVNDQRRITQRIAQRHSKSRAGLHPDQRSRVLRPPPDLGEHLQHDPGAALAIGIPESLASLETQRQRAVTQRSGGGAIVIHYDALRSGATVGGTAQECERRRNQKEGIFHNPPCDSTAIDFMFPDAK